MAAKWTKATNVIWEELDSGALLIDATTGARWTLNATAAALWSWCDGSSTLNDLAAQLAQSSRRTLREARAEVRAFCAQFAEQKVAGAGERFGNDSGERDVHVQRAKRSGNVQRARFGPRPALAAGTARE